MARRAFERGQFPPTSLPQLYSDLVHAGVIFAVVVMATILRGMDALDNGTVGNVYTAAIGYAAGRAGSVTHRQFSMRKEDPPASETSVDASS